MVQKVAILWASDNPERYSYKAFQMLKEYQHIPILISPKLKELEEHQVFSSLGEVSDTIDTLTMYVGPELSEKLKHEILAVKPRRIIFNPGSENAPLQAELKNAGIHVIEACTLVLLRTNQFEKA